MSKYVNGKEAKEQFLKGKVVEMGDRYYRYKNGKVEYIDYWDEKNPNVKWKESIHDVEKVIRDDAREMWRVL